MNTLSRLFAFALVLAALIVCLTVASAKQDKCPVCHNGKNPHTIFIPCDKVQKYLNDHPGDYAGECQGVSKEKPPKPSPTPKP